MRPLLKTSLGRKLDVKLELEEAGQRRTDHEVRSAQSDNHHEVAPILANWELRRNESHVSMRTAAGQSPSWDNKGVE